MSSKRKEYHFDCCAAKVAKFFLMCKSYINPDMRIKIPAAMMAKGYSNEESKNRALQMQVRREVEKISGLDPPCPPKAVAAAKTALLSLLAPPNATRVTLAMITPVTPLATAGNGDLLAGVLIPSPLRKTQKTSHQKQLQNQNNKKKQSIHNQAHARATTLVVVEREKEEKENHHTTNMVITQVEGEFKARGFEVHLTKATINCHVANGMIGMKPPP
jgi:hypothetical protein